VIVEDGATHSQKDSVESNGGSLQAGAEAFTLLLHGAQLVLQSSLHVLKVLDLNEVNVTLKNAEVFGSVLSGEVGSVGGLLWQWIGGHLPGCGGGGGLGVGVAF